MPPQLHVMCMYTSRGFSTVVFLYSFSAVARAIPAKAPPPPPLLHVICVHLAQQLLGRAWLARLYNCIPPAK